MVSTQAVFEAESQVVDLHADSALVAEVAEVLAAYEQAASSCAAGMIAEPDVGELRDAIIAALDSVDVVQATHRVVSRAGDARLQRLMLEAASAALERCAELCGAHAGHHDHRRLHADAGPQGDRGLPADARSALNRQGRRRSWWPTPSRGLVRSDTRPGS
jgi:hypothetical protein